MYKVKGRRHVNSVFSDWSVRALLLVRVYCAVRCCAVFALLGVLWCRNKNGKTKRKQRVKKAKRANKKSRKAPQLYVIIIIIFPLGISG